MELVPAPSLDDVLRASGPLPPDRVARIGLEMLDALRAARSASSTASRASRPSAGRPGPVPPDVRARRGRPGKRPVSYFAQAAEAESTLVKRGTPGELHGRARVFTITSGGQEYLVQITALSATWDRSQPIFNAFFTTFRPAT